MGGLASLGYRSPFLSRFTPESQLECGLCSPEQSKFSGKSSSRKHSRKWQSVYVKIVCWQNTVSIHETTDIVKKKLTEQTGIKKDLEEAISNRDYWENQHSILFEEIKGDLPLPWP